MEITATEQVDKNPIEAADSGLNISWWRIIFCSAQFASESWGSRRFMQEGNANKDSFYFSCKRLTRLMCPCVCLDVFVFIRLCLSSRAGQITWLHMLTDPNTCLSHRPALPRPPDPFVSTEWAKLGTTMATEWIFFILFYCFILCRISWV